MSHIQVVSVRQPLGLHGPAIRHRDRVELQMQFIGQVERNLLGTLRLDDALILVEDGVLERLQYRIRLIEVVIAADDAVALTLVRTDRAGSKEVQGRCSS